MKYWSTATLLNNRHLGSASKQEIRRWNAQKTLLAYDTIIACKDVAFNSPTSVLSLALVWSGNEARRVFIQRPTQLEWDALERGGFIATHDDFGFVMDALH